MTNESAVNSRLAIHNCHNLNIITELKQKGLNTSAIHLFCDRKGKTRNVREITLRKRSWSNFCYHEGRGGGRNKKHCESPTGIEPMTFAHRSIAALQGELERVRKFVRFNIILVPYPFWLLLASRVLARETKGSGDMGFLN